MHWALTPTRQHPGSGLDLSPWGVQIHKQSGQILLPGQRLRYALTHKGWGGSRTASDTQVHVTPAFWQA